MGQISTDFNPNGDDCEYSYYAGRRPCTIVMLVNHKGGDD